LYTPHFDGLKDLNDIKSQIGPFKHIKYINLVGSISGLSAAFNQNALSFYNLCTTTTVNGTEESDAAEGHCAESNMQLYILEKDYLQMNLSELKVELARYNLSNDDVGGIFDTFNAHKKAVAMAYGRLIDNLRKQLTDKLRAQYGTSGRAGVVHRTLLQDDRITQLAEGGIARINGIMDDKPNYKRSVLDELTSITREANVELDNTIINDLLDKRGVLEKGTKTYLQTINDLHVPPRYLLFVDGGMEVIKQERIRGIIPLRNIIPLHKLTISELGAPIVSSLGKTLWNNISSAGNIQWNAGDSLLRSLDEMHSTDKKYIQVAREILTNNGHVWPPPPAHDQPQSMTHNMIFAKAVSILILWKTRGFSTKTWGAPLNKRVRYHYDKPPTDPFRFIKDAFYFSYYTTPLPTRDGTDISAYEHKPDDYTNPNITTCRVSCVGGDDFYDTLMLLALDDYNRRPMLEPLEPVYTTICDYLYGGPLPGTYDHPSGYQYDKVPLNLTGQFMIENIKEQVIATHKAYMEQTLDNVIICQKNKDSGSADAAAATEFTYNDFTRVLCDTFIPSKDSPTSEGRTREYISLYLLAYWYGLNPFTLNPLVHEQVVGEPEDISADATAISDIYYSDNYKIGDDKHLKEVKNKIINSSWFTDIKDYKIYITMTDGEGKHYMITDSGSEWVVKEMVVQEMDAIDPTVMFTDSQLHTYWMEGTKTDEAKALSDILNKHIEISRVHYKINYIKMKPSKGRYPSYFEHHKTPSDQCFILTKMIVRQDDILGKKNQIFRYGTVIGNEAQVFYDTDLEDELEDELED
jgi:hypothetical protein